MNAIQTEQRPRRLGTRHWVFIGSVVALDFAVGQLSKSLLHASGVTNFVRLDMFLPVVLWMLTRLIIDRFGVLTAYQFAWGTLAIFAFPGAMLPVRSSSFPPSFKVCCTTPAFPCSDVSPEDVSSCPPSSAGSSAPSR